MAISTYQVSDKNRAVGKKCAAGCRRRIKARDQVTNVNGLIYHRHCYEQKN